MKSWRLESSRLVSFLLLFSGFSHLKDADMLWLRAGTPSVRCISACGCRCDVLVKGGSVRPI